MADVNWWLMALAFVLGVGLTFAFTTRRITGEVPPEGAATPAGGPSAETKDSGEEHQT